MSNKFNRDFINEEPTAEELKQIENDCISDFDYEGSSSSVSDPISLYLKEIGSVPLLSEEEEFQCGFDLEMGKSLTIVTRNNNLMLDLDFGKLFISLENNENKDIILSSLIECYTSLKKEKYNVPLKKLSCYQDMCIKLGRTPNLAELKLAFRDLDFCGEKLAEKELLSEISIYLKYVLAFDKMVNSNLRLVVNVAKQYAKKCRLPVLDIIGEGNLGLIKAVSKYDVTKGFRFSTYATWWIRQTTTRYLYANSSTLSVPEYIAKDAKRIRKEVEELEKKEGRKIPISELATKYNMKEDTILGCITTAVDDVISFSHPVGEMEDSTVEDYLFDENDNVENRYFNQYMLDDMDVLFKPLTPREASIIRLRFGIGSVDGNPQTLEEVGKKYKLTRERIRQIEARALKKMRKVAHTTEAGKDLISYLK